MEDDKIIRPKFGDAPVTIDSAPPSCTHAYVTLRSRDSTVICRLCRRQVDAFGILFKLTREWDWATHFEQEVKDRSNRIDALKKEESLIKGRLRSAQRSAPEQKSTLYFEELMRRIAAVEQHGEFWKLDQWKGSFKWLDKRQEAAVRDALVHAVRRVEDNQKNSQRRRGRHVEVLPGGKAGEAK